MRPDGQCARSLAGPAHQPRNLDVLVSPALADQRAAAPVHAGE